MANAKEQNIVGGMLLLLLACLCSSFAGIFTEMIFKRVGVAGQSQEKTSLWLQNMQMATYTMVVVVMSFIYETRHEIAKADSITGLVFRGFTLKVWGLVVINAIGGILVALVIKYADNILRGFASALATINSTLLAVVCFGFQVGGGFALGTTMVIASAMLYGGVVKIPGDWWNTAPSLCGLLPAPTAQIEPQKVENGAKYAGVETADSPHAQVVGNRVELDEEVEAIIERQDIPIEEDIENVGPCNESHPIDSEESHLKAAASEELT
eukprot:CAMPEP_0172671104 /NCGR_PEP_ID=MMETSP1074-20121228/10707_1 /TAXON_ID=2916 /ORGANISM="Ceratium fusus, Strain PA161109" /LENGTH=267 /DNA_ID=CAMNT_0013488099 /DNA_START=553 /DNA_END=1356 /DNA_ORIENTATION=+